MPQKTNATDKQSAHNHSKLAKDVALQPAIVASVADFTPGAVNKVSVQPGFVARAVVMPPGTIAGVPAKQFTVVAYVTDAMSPAPLPIPNVAGILVVDLPNGMLPPVGSPKGSTIYELITTAITTQLSPDPPGGTGNDKPPQ